METTMTQQEKQIIKTKYKDICKALHNAQSELLLNKKSVRKRTQFEFVSAQEMAVFNLCIKLGIELDNENI